MPFLNLTPAVGSFNSLFFNVSYTIADQPPQMTTPTVWIIFALTGIALLLISALTSSDACNDLSGIMAVPLLLVSAIQSFAVDVITSTSFAQGTTAPLLGVVTQTHTVYHYDLIGVVLGIFFVLSLANLYRLWLDHKRVTNQPNVFSSQASDTDPGAVRGGRPQGANNNRGSSGENEE